MPSPHKKAEHELKRFALTYPETREDFPWGERVVKVRGKVFVFLWAGDDFHVTVKLPQSATLALTLPFVSPTGYGLGKSGWVTATFSGKARPPVEVLKQWIDESYRAVAPKKLVAELTMVGLASKSRAQRGNAGKQRAQRKGHRAG